MAKISGIPTAVPAVGLATHLGRPFQRVGTVADLDAAVLTRGTGKRVTSVSVIGDDSGASATGGRHLGRGMQAESTALKGVRRCVAALEDLDTVALLEKSL